MRHFNFKDNGGMKCQVSMASTSEPKLWVGPRDPGDRGIGLGKGRRMLLTQKQADALGYMLLRFAIKGELSTMPHDAKQMADLL